MVCERRGRIESVQFRKKMYWYQYTRMGDEVECRSIGIRDIQIKHYVISEKYNELVEMEIRRRTVSYKQEIRAYTY